MYVYYTSPIPTRIAPFIYALPDPLEKIVWLLILIVIGLAGMFLAHAPAWFLPVRCSRPGCGGTAKLIYNMPYTYRCCRCGHVHKTRISQGGRK